MKMYLGQNRDKIPSIQIYRYLLRLYPAEFRTGFGEEMIQVFQDTCRRSLEQSGRRGLIRVWLWAIRDLSINLWAEYWILLHQRQTALAKRLFDCCFATLILMLCLPLFLLIALLIKRDSSGPIFFCQNRLGRDGQAFRLLKFRTMIATANGRQITRLGSALRPLGLDELPQLLNVLKGEMSLIGPRPELRETVDLTDKRWQQVLSVRPGIAGVSQLMYKSRTTLTEKLTFNLHYVRQHSLWLDLKIMGKTLSQLIHRLKEEQ